VTPGATTAGAASARRAATATPGAATAAAAPPTTAAPATTPAPAATTLGNEDGRRGGFRLIGSEDRIQRGLRVHAELGRVRFLNCQTDSQDRRHCVRYRQCRIREITCRTDGPALPTSLATTGQHEHQSEA
jgi:hypothetical protein